ncbi:MAG TPA: ABC transporter permease, partial [Gemmatimonadaceae bacterium]|nr:ABC transporter permease [Gemmatimonadaceae bacterium]
MSDTPRPRRVFRIPFSRAALRSGVDDELRFHIEGRIEELMSKGLSRADAEREARRRFGDIGVIGHELETIDRQSMRRGSVREQLSALVFDARYALRGMARRPLYTAIVVVTLALGIGANTAIFSLVNAVLLHPLPTPGLNHLVVIEEDILGLNLRDAQLSPGETVDLFARHDLFATVAAQAGRSMNLTGQGEPQRVSVVRTFGDYFGLFAVRPYLGRIYRPESSTAPGTHVAVASYGFWQQMLGADQRAIGRALELDGTKFEVIGVLPPDFQYPRSAQLYVPFQLDPVWLTPERRNSLFMTVMARPRDGLSAEQVAAGLRMEVRRWHDRFPGYDIAGQFVLHATPFVAYIAGDLRAVLLALMGAVALVLLIACANVGSLQLVLAARRSKEIAVRAALGAGRATIVRWLLVEALVLAIVGGVLGIGIGVVILRLVTRLNAAEYRLLTNVHLDARVLAFTSAVVVVAALLFGVIPAIRAARVDLQDALKDSARGSSLSFARHRFLQASVVVQVALTLMLLLASTLTVRSLARVLELDPGFRPEHVTTMQLTLPGARYGNNTARLAFYNTLIERLRALPGMESVGLASYLPFNGGTDSSPFELPGRPPAPNEPPRHANTEVIAGDYFRAMGIPILRGRTFTAADAEGAEGVIVDEYLAKSFFPNEDPIGKAIIHNNRATIIGVVRSVTQEYLGQAPHPTVYHYYGQEPWLGFTTAVMRSSLPDEQITTLARGAVRAMDPQLPVFDIKSMPERISASLTPRRLAMYVLLGFAALSLALSVLGIYGVISYSTAQRTQEIGIRMALGANPADVTRMVLRDAMLLAVIGVVAGSLLFLGVGRVLASVLYGIGPRDPLTIALGVVVLAGVALGAAYVPAR